MFKHSLHSTLKNLFFIHSEYFPNGTKTSLSMIFMSVVHDLHISLPECRVVMSVPWYLWPAMWDSLKLLCLVCEAYHYIGRTFHSLLCTMFDWSFYVRFFHHISFLAAAVLVVTNATNKVRPAKPISVCLRSITTLSSQLCVCH